MINIYINYTNMGQPQPLFVYFPPFLNTITNIVQNKLCKSIDGVLRIRTRDRKIERADESTELGRTPINKIFCYH